MRDTSEQYCAFLDSLVGVTTVLCDRADEGSLDEILRMLSERERLLERIENLRMRADTTQTMEETRMGGTRRELVVQSLIEKNRELIERLSKRKEFVYRQLQESYTQKSYFQQMR